VGNKIKRFFENILNLIYPKGLSCISCAKELDDNEREYALCIPCLNALKITEGDMKIANGISVYSCFYYESVARQLVLSYKDSDKPFISEYMARFIRDKYIEKELCLDGIVFVPSSAKKINKRGYDALKQVAVHLSKMLNLPILLGLEKKNVATDLTQVQKEKRQEVIKDTFFVKDNSHLKGKKVLLIDDVITTGATLTECASELYKANVKKVEIITFTRALH
jgi:competence protein ComFC